MVVTDLDQGYCSVMIQGYASVITTPLATSVMSANGDSLDFPTVHAKVCKSQLERVSTNRDVNVIA